MPGKYNYEERLKYPHLIGEDSVIWNKFFLRFPRRFDTVDYDVHVGKGVNVSTIQDSIGKNYWSNLTKKRIDVIGYKDNIITIIEVKKRVGLHTLGQILGYKFLYLREHPELKSIRTLIICSSIDQDDIAVLQHYAIDFFIV